MISLEETLTLMAEGKRLPQQKFGRIPKSVVGDILKFEPELLNGAYAALKDGDDPVAFVCAKLDVLCDRYGWYPACSTLAMVLAHRYSVDQVPDLPSLDGDTGTLLKIFAIAAARENVDKGAWTIPLAMLASLKDEGARIFTSCAAFVAACAVLLEAGGVPE